MEDIDITSLTSAQKRALVASLSNEEIHDEIALRGVDRRVGGKQATYTDDESLIWDMINDVVGHRRQLGDILIKAGKSRVAFAEDVEHIMTWLDRGCGQKLTRTQRRAIVGEAIQCLASHVERGSATMSHKTLLQQRSPVPSALNRAFPGYQSARVLDRIAAIAA